MLYLIKSINLVSGKKVSRSKRKVSTEVFIEEGQLASDDNRTVIQQPEPWTILAHTKPKKHWVPYNPRNMRPPRLPRDTKTVKLMSWNVNGLRALMKVEGFSALELAQREDFDVLCLQETKLQVRAVSRSSFFSSPSTALPIFTFSFYKNCYRKRMLKQSGILL